MSQQALLSLGWGRTPHQRLVAAARQLAIDVQARESIALARLVADTGDAQPAQVEFTQPALLYWRTDGGAHRGNLTQIRSYYRELHRGRMVIQGPAGAGKTVLAIALTRALATDFLRAHPDAPINPVEHHGQRWVAVRVSAAAFDPAGAARADQAQPDQVTARLDDWLTDQLRTVYGIGRREAAALVADGWILPVLDGIDEMDPPGQPPQRAAAVLAGLNQPIRAADGTLRPVVLTCRTDRYTQLAAPPPAIAPARPQQHSGRKGEALQDATVVQVEPLTPTAARDYLLFRFPDPAGSSHGQPRWRPILARLAPTQVPRDVSNPVFADTTDSNDCDGVDQLVAALRSPLRLFLAVDGYRDPTTDPTELIRFPDAQHLDAHLFALLIPAAVARQSGTRCYTSEQVARWLTTLAHHLDARGRAGGSGTDLQLDQLWRVAGPRLPRYITATILPLAFVAFALWIYLSFRTPSVDLGNNLGRSVIAAGALAVVAAAAALAVTALRPDTDLRRFDFRVLSSPRVQRRLALAIVLGIVGSFVGGVAGLLTVEMAVTIVGSLVAGLSVRPRAIDSPRQLVIQGITHLVGTLAVVSAIVAAVLVFGGIFGAEIAVGLAGGIGAVGALEMRLVVLSPWPRYGVACILLRLQHRLPWRPARFLDWAYQAGMMRVAGLSLQFRHSQFQAWLTDQLANDPPP